MTRAEFRDLSFQYPGLTKKVFEEMSWIGEEGMTYGLVGMNGSGKSTFLRLLAGLIRPTAGKVLIQDIEVKGTNQTKNSVTYVPENAKLFLVGPTPRQDLTRLIRDPDQANSYYEQPTFASLADKRLYHLSEGQRRLVSLYHAFLSSKELLLLDEPTIGLDQNGRAFLTEQLNRAKSQGRLVIVSTNDTRILPYLDRLVLVGQGKVLLDGPPAEVLYALEEITGLLPNQVVQLVSRLEELLDRQLPHPTSVEEFQGTEMFQ